jgi:hypothetical protein
MLTSRINSLEFQINHKMNGLDCKRYMVIEKNRAILLCAGSNAFEKNKRKRKREKQYKAMRSNKFLPSELP